MSRKTITTAAVVAVATLALLTTAALAGLGDRRGQAGDDCRGMRPSFTTEQKEEMKEIRESFEDERVGLQNEMKVLHLEMQELAEADSPDFGKLEQMIDEVTELQAQMMKLRLKQHRAVREILDDDQRVLFDRSIAGKLARGGHGDRGGRAAMRGGMRGGADCGQMGRGGKMSCGPQGTPGARMFRGDDGELVEILKRHGGEDGERRIIVKKIVDGDEIILEVEEEE